jgi:hypothetical protein
MRSKWFGKHVEASELASVVKEYFEKLNFEVEERSKTSGYELTVLGKTSNPSLSIAVIDIYGDDREMTVDYYPGGERKSSFHSRVLDSVKMMIGAGALVWMDQKSQEVLDRFEDDFWKFLDEFFEKVT